MGPSRLLQDTLKPPEECARILKNAKKIVVLDIETTGFSPTKHAEIIEIGAVKIDPKKHAPVAGFSQLIKPSNGYIPPSITKVTNINSGMVKDSPYFETVLPEFYDFLGDAVVVAHNAKFDWFRFLQEYMLRVGRIVTNDIVCSMELSRLLHPGLKKHTLADVCDYYKCPIVGHHRAFVDAKYTASACLRMYDEIVVDALLGKYSGEPDWNVQPSEIGFVDPKDVTIVGSKFFSYSDKRAGKAIIFTTSVGRVYYNFDHDLWGVYQMSAEKNVDLAALAKVILKKYHVKTPQEFLSIAA